MIKISIFLSLTIRKQNSMCAPQMTVYMLDPTTRAVGGSDASPVPCVQFATFDVEKSTLVIEDEFMLTVRHPVPFTMHT